MKNWLKIVFLSILLLFLYIYWSFDKVFEHERTNKHVASKWEQKTIDISVVACGVEKVDEILVLIKSEIIFFAKTQQLKFWIATEKELFQTFHDKIENFRNNNNCFSYILREIKYPHGQEDTWGKLFKPCASRHLC